MGVGRVFLSYVTFRRSRQALLTRETRTKKGFVFGRGSLLSLVPIWFRVRFPGFSLIPHTTVCNWAHNLSKLLGCNVFVLGERDYKADEQLIRLNGTITNTLYLSCTLCYGSPRSPPRSFRQSVSIGVRVRRARDRLLRELP